MTRRFGVDVSHFQDTKAPAGVPWETLAEKSTFLIARLSYGGWADPNASGHIQHARTEAMQVGGYHFLVTDQDVQHQLDVFLAQAVRCGIGAGDILPALDIEDDGPRKITPAIEPIVRRACDILIAEFGGVITYITARDWARMGSPTWLLELAQWTANYTNAPKPMTPGNVVPAIWQNKVGIYGPGTPFVAKDAYLPNAIDQDVADAPLPLCTLKPRMPGGPPPAAVFPSPPEHTVFWQQRIDALTDSAYAGLDLSHDAESSDAFFGDEADTNPINPTPRS